MTTPKIDKLTIELMMNKTQYKKYLAKREPAKFQEQEEDFQRTQLNRAKILAIFTDLLDNPTAQYTHNIESLFVKFTNESIEYIETQEYMKKDTDADELFAEHTSAKPPSVLNLNSSTSFWGGKVSR